MSEHVPVFAAVGSTPPARPNISKWNADDAMAAASGDTDPSEALEMAQVVFSRSGGAHPSWGTCQTLRKQRGSALAMLARLASSS